MKDLKDAKAAAEQQKHVTVINWMKEKKTLKKLIEIKWKRLGQWKVS